MNNNKKSDLTVQTITAIPLISVCSMAFQNVFSPLKKQKHCAIRSSLFIKQLYTDVIAIRTKKAFVFSKNRENDRAGPKFCS